MNYVLMMLNIGRRSLVKDEGAAAVIPCASEEEYKAWNNGYRHGYKRAYEEMMLLFEGCLLSDPSATAVR